jgi:hypothetical protein
VFLPHNTNAKPFKNSSKKDKNQDTEILYVIFSFERKNAEKYYATRISTWQVLRLLVFQNKATPNPRVWCL